MLFLDKLAAHCHTHPQKTALEFLGAAGSQKITYGELESTVQSRMAYLASLGLEPGDRAALYLPTCLEFIYLHLAAMRLGAVSLPLNPRFPSMELAYFLSDSEAKL